MTPEVFAQAIVSIERNYGLRLDPLAVWTRLDAVQCGKGWIGTNPPGCKRSKRIGRMQKSLNTPSLRVNAFNDDAGHPRGFRSKIDGQDIQISSMNNHDPSWVQNASGATVFGQKSRSFSVQPGQGDLDVLELEPQSFRTFVEKIRRNKAYEGVEEFSVAEVFKNRILRPSGEITRQKQMSNLKKLVDADLVTVSEVGSPFQPGLSKDMDDLISQNARIKVSVNFDKEGKIRKASALETSLIPNRIKATTARGEQSELIEEEHGSGLVRSPKELAGIRRRETIAAQKVAVIEDDLYARKPKKIATEGEYVKKAQDWAKSQGFVNDGSDINGFTAKQAAKHDIAHPATHDLVGLDSKGLNNYFGGLRTASGSRSLVGEEGIVNAVEHLSRGDTPESSLMSGVRVSRMLSRNGTPDEIKFFRCSGFVKSLNELVEKAIKMDDYGSISKVVRESNWLAGTVKRMGNT